MTGRWVRQGAGVGLVVMGLGLTACASHTTIPTTTVLLLPQVDGTPSSVTVTGNNGLSAVVATPYQTATNALGDRQAPRLAQADPNDVRRKFGPLFDALPAKPQRFTLYFKAGSTELTAESRIALLDAMLDAQQRSGAEIVIVGHTDATGSPAINDRLAQRRAAAVHALLSERGFTRSIVDVKAMGGREPAVPAGNAVPEPRNRRVEVIVR